MVCAKKCPAVTAGLIGLLSFPQAAEAATMLGVSEEVLANTLPPFMFGCIAGGALAGAVAHALMARRMAELESEVAMQRIELSNQAEVLAEQTKVGAAPIQASKAALQDAEELVNPATGRGEQAQQAQQAARFKTETSTNLLADYTGDLAANYTGSVRTPKHERVDWEHTGNIRVTKFEGEKPTSESATNTAVPVPVAPVAGEQDYAEVAANYVEQMSFAERMATRARGVAMVLQERIGSGFMGGLPVIRRADGTTGDVGTLWWDAMVGEDIQTNQETPQAFEEFGSASEELHVPEFTHEAEVEFVQEEELNTTGDIGTASEAEREESSRERSVAISQRIARVEQALYPEVREIDDVKAELDAWEAALSALEENTAVAISSPEVLAFEDDLGGLDTLEEPVGLEGETEFLPFRMVAGHPEVDNVESYIDYLLADELSQNSSDYMRNQSPSYLKVIEGGSSKLPVLEGGSSKMPALEGTSAPSAKRGKHFKVEELEQFDEAIEA